MTTKELLAAAPTFIPVGTTPAVGMLGTFDGKPATAKFGRHRGWPEGSDIVVTMVSVGEKRLASPGPVFSRDACYVVVATTTGWEFTRKI